MSKENDILEKVIKRLDSERKKLPEDSYEGIFLAIGIIKMMQMEKKLKELEVKNQELINMRENDINDALVKENARLKDKLSELKMIHVGWKTFQYSAHSAMGKIEEELEK